MKTCEYCGKEYESTSARSKFCLDKCKMASHRSTPRTAKHTEKTPVVLDEPKIKPIEEKRIPKQGDPDWPGSPGWYIHGTADDPNKTWDRVCVVCGKDYTTSLELMRFCSEECREDIMTAIANGPHKRYQDWAQKQRNKNA